MSYANLLDVQAFQTYSRTEKKSWFDARDHCRALGGDLASLHAQHIDQDSIKTIFQYVLYNVCLMQHFHQLRVEKYPTMQYFGIPVIISQ